MHRIYVYKGIKTTSEFEPKICDLMKKIMTICNTFASILFFLL